MVEVKLKYPCRLLIVKKCFLDQLEPTKEAESPLLFSKSFFLDFNMKIFFLKVYCGSFGDEKAIYEKTSSNNKEVIDLAPLTAWDCRKRWLTAKKISDRHILFEIPT